MILPNFFIVGAAKAGTTSLYNYFRQHEEIYMSPIKEPHYFSKDIKYANFNKLYKKNAFVDFERYFKSKPLRNLPLAYIEKFEDYLRLFEDAQNYKAIGEASVSYLYSRAAAKEIRNCVSNAKIIIILRNPVERAFSHYLMDLRTGIVRGDFLCVVKEDISASSKGWGISHLYIELGLYYEQVKRYLDLFPLEDVKIILFEEFKNDTLNVLMDLFDFLGVKQRTVDVSERYNSAQIPRFELLNEISFKLGIGRFFHGVPENIKRNIKRMIFKPVTTRLTKKEFDCLIGYFAEDIKNLEGLIGRDLSRWLNFVNE